MCGNLKLTPVDIKTRLLCNVENPFFEVQIATFSLRNCLWNLAIGDTSTTVGAYGLFQLLPGSNMFPSMIISPSQQFEGVCKALKKLAAYLQEPPCQSVSWSMPKFKQIRLTKCKKWTFFEKSNFLEVWRQLCIWTVLEFRKHFQKFSNLNFDV